MTAQIIQFPTRFEAPRPRFGEWLTDQVGGRWCVVKQRRATRHGFDMSDRVQLLPREYGAWKATYEATYGAVYA